MMRMQKVYDLEERTYQFARNCRLLIEFLPRTINNIEDARQLVRSSGSVGANYIEANENLGRKDLAMRLKIARKEAKEAGYWLRILSDLNPGCSDRIQPLMQEANELRKIMSSILNRTEASVAKQPL